MNNLNLPKSVIIIIRAITIFIIFCLILFFALYSSGWLPLYPKIQRDNIDDYLGDDLWLSIIEKYEKVEIDNLPLKSQKESIRDYCATIKISVQSKEQWLKNAVDISADILQYLIDNPKCTINSYDRIAIYIEDDTGINCVEFTNIYDFGNKYEKLDGFDCIRIFSKDESFISFSDIMCFSNTKYLIANIPISINTDFQLLSKLDSVNELSLFINDDLKKYVKEKIDSLKLNYSVNVY